MRGNEALLRLSLHAVCGAALRSARVNAAQYMIKDNIAFDKFCTRRGGDFDGYGGGRR